MALYQYFSKVFPDKETDVYFESIPEQFGFLESIQKRKTTCSDGKKYDLFVVVDSSDKERLGDAGVYFENAKRTICVDHHISNLNYADLNIVKANASSTAEVIYQLLEEENIDCEIATALYLGIIHDSGVFKYESTSRKTMEIAGVLIEKGVDTAKVIDETFYQKTYIQNQILGGTIGKYDGIRRKRYCFLCNPKNDGILWSRFWGFRWYHRTDAFDKRRRGGYLIGGNRCSYL